MKNKNIPKSNFLSLHLSSASIFENSDINTRVFSKEMCKVATQKFISSYEAFTSLKDEKWSI